MKRNLSFRAHTRRVGGLFEDRGALRHGRVYTRMGFVYVLMYLGRPHVRGDHCWTTYTYTMGGRNFFWREDGTRTPRGATRKAHSLIRGLMAGKYDVTGGKP